MAIVKDGNHFCMISEETSSALIPIPDSDVRLCLGSLNDLTELDAGSVEELLEEVRMRQSSDRALQLALVLLDREEPREVRSEAAECLRELFSSKIVVRYVANRLYSAPMPEVADLEQAIKLCKADSATQEFFRGLLSDQQEIFERWKVWEELPVQLFGSLQEKCSFHSVATREGAFRLFVTERDKGDWALYQMLSHPKFRGDPKARVVFQEWYKPFKMSYTPDRSVFSEESVRQTVKSSQTQVSAHEAFKKAERQRSTIKKLLVKGHLRRALRYTDELILNQRRSSQPEHLAKSLCDLAQFAKECGSPELQLTFAKKATEEAPQDAWAYATLGDAYRGVTQYQEALDAFQKSVVFGNHHTGNLGRAEVLKELGQLDDALEVLEFCVREFPGDEVAANSWAAALADFGRFNEALEAYNQLLKDNPYNQVTRSGRAQVLRLLGRLPEALRDLDAIVNENPQESIPSFARAEVMREMGNLDEAEREMRSLINRFPSDPYPRLGLARILRDLGRFGEALAAFDESIRSHPLNMAGLVGKGDTYRKLGNLGRAKGVYEDVVKQVNSVRYVRFGLASVLVAQSDYTAALALLPDKLPATKSEWVAYHIRGMTFLRSGDFSNARQVLEWGMNECPWGEQREYFATALATCRIREGRYTEAIGLVENVSSVSVSPTSRAIGMHAYAGLGDDQGFHRAYDAIPVTASPIVLNLRDSLVDLYKSKKDIQIKTEQIFAAECDSLLLAA